MNIVIINHYASSPEYGGAGFRHYYMAKEWVKYGHEVTIIAASESHVRISKPLITGNWTQENIEGVRYIWLKTPSYHGNGIGRILNMLSFFIKIFQYNFKIKKEFEPDCVIVSSPQPLVIYPAYFLAKITHSKLVFEVRDLWPLSPMKLGGMSKWHPFIIAMQWTENFAYRMADKVISLLPKASDYMAEHGMKKHKFVYIPNGINLSDWGESKSEEILPEEHQAIIQQAKKDNKFIVMYAGTHGLANALDTLVDTALILQNQPVQIIMVGQGPEKENLRQKALDAGITNIVFLAPVSKRKIPSLLMQADVLYIGWKKNTLYRFGISPNKLMDYMMAVKPIIHAVEAANDSVAESGCGISISPENPRELARAILEMMNKSPAEREKVGQNGRNYVINNHDYKILAQEFIEAIRQ